RGRSLPAERRSINPTDGSYCESVVDPIPQGRPQWREPATGVLRSMAMSTRSDLQAAAERLQQEWRTSPRWRGITRKYGADDVARLRGSLQVEYTLARRGAQRLWDLLTTQDYVPTLGALTGNQAVQQVKAGLKAIYLSGWQVAADANVAGQMYPDQSLYPVNSVPDVVRRINAALRRADQ